MKKLVYAFTLVTMTQTHSHQLFWSVQSSSETIGYCVDLRLENTFDNFLSAIDAMPRFLEVVTHQHVPIIIIAPQELDGFSPLAHEAPAIEGARTALTWMRSYYQVLGGNYDLRIIKVPTGKTPSREELVAFMFSQKPIVATAKTLEDDLLRCITIYNSTTDTSALPSSWTLSSYDVPYSSVEPQTISLPSVSKNETVTRYLVAGGSGFIGYHIVKALLAEGNRVIVLDNNACSSPDNLKEFLSHPRFTFVHHDITVPFTIEGPLNVIINLASIPSPAFYYRLPLETLRTGLQGTLNLLALARAKHARYVFTSTSEVYGDPLVHPQTEDYPGLVNYLGKRAQYDQSKRGAETLLKLSFQADPTLDIRIARLFNTYGPPMMLHDGRVVTNFIANIMDNKPLVIYGDGTQTRSFGYVEDTVKGILSLVHNEQLSREPLITNRVFNLGTPYEMTVNELAEKVDQLCQQKYGRHATINYVPKIDNTDPCKRLPDITRAHNALGFDPHIQLEEGLEKTWTYFEHKKAMQNISKKTLTSPKGA